MFWITLAQAAAGLSWTSPIVASVVATRTANVTAGTTLTSLDFLATTPIRPDHTDDEDDGDVGLGRQSLSEALARAMLKSRPITIDLQSRVYSLSTGDALVVDGPNTGLITLRSAGDGYATLDRQKKGTDPILVIVAGFRVAAEGVVFINCHSEFGGAAVRNEGEFYALDCEFVGCTSTIAGGAIASFGTTTLDSCELGGNSAPHGGAVAVQSGACTIVNSWLDENSATLEGGGIFVGSGRLVLRHSSIFKNQAPHAGGLKVVGGGSASISHCLIGLNRSLDGFGDGAGPITSLGFNLIERPGGFIGTLQSSDVVGKSPKIGLDGFLQPDSPAIDAGDPAFDPSTLPLDGPGNDRKTGPRIDIGAVEFTGTVAGWTLGYFSRTVADDPAKEATDWGATADPDKDGVVNTLERALGGDPTTAGLTLVDGTALLPAIQKSAGAVDYQFALDERYTDLRYIVQTSSDAAPWLDAATFVPLGGGQGFRRDPAPGSPTTPGPSSSSRSRFLINEMLPIQPGQKHLLRLKVVGSP